MIYMGRIRHKLSGGIYVGNSCCHHGSMKSLVITKGRVQAKLNARIWLKIEAFAFTSGYPWSNPIRLHSYYSYGYMLWQCYSSSRASCGTHEVNPG